MKDIIRTNPTSNYKRNGDVKYNEVESTPMGFKVNYQLGNTDVIPTFYFNKENGNLYVVV